MSVEIIEFTVEIEADVTLGDVEVQADADFVVEVTTDVQWDPEIQTTLLFEVEV